jgi:hypothetical protein
VSIAAGGSTAATVNSTGLSVTGNLDFSRMITQSGTALLRADADSVYLGLGAVPSATVLAGGASNSAFGAGALGSIASGADNTAVGYLAGGSITSTGSNVAVGSEALAGASGTGTRNTAVGALAGAHATGSNNTYIGLGAGGTGGTGSDNTFVGTYAGGNVTTGSYNIFIANQGPTNPDTESGTIRIGDTAQTQTFISGIYNVTPAISGGLPVVIDSAGQLGTTSSSRRFKTDIADMGDTTETLMTLRPVQFRYIAHGPGAPLQYGLIAEEVAEVAPELVAHSADGEIETVFYDKVNAMLLNQVQTQQRQIEKLESRLAELESRVK